MNDQIFEHFASLMKLCPQIPSCDFLDAWYSSERFKNVIYVLEKEASRLQAEEVKQLLKEKALRAEEANKEKDFLIDAWYSSERFKNVIYVLEKEASRLQAEEVKQLLKEKALRAEEANKEKDFLIDEKSLKEALKTEIETYCINCNCKVTNGTKTGKKLFVSYYQDSVYKFEWYQFYCKDCE